jgi:hypothetical protein
LDVKPTTPISMDGVKELKTREFESQPEEKEKRNI